ncbi:MAG TPA: dATP/dGTP diphosphohydrolase domain-containing protein [Terriglobia bacterium]|nr:dATP/dGTP diphosphohydrolase domain-containing protein [Terriglobia bacterium]
MSEGRKDDGGKDPWHLAPFDAFRAIIKVLAFGAQKYAPRNWENGMAWSRCFAALMRHLTSWWEGEPCDPETGFSHLWHAGCCICFLISFELRAIGTDDRPTRLKP